jgi:hypothetical protein
MEHECQLLAHNIELGLHTITDNIVMIIPQKSTHFILELIHCQNNMTQHITLSSQLKINETDGTTTYNSSTQFH